MAAAATLLAEVETAISSCLNAQSYGIRSRQKQMARLAELQDFRRELISEIQEASTNSGSMATVGQIDPPS